MLPSVPVLQKITIVQDKKWVSRENASVYLSAAGFNSWPPRRPLRSAVVRGTEWNTRRKCRLKQTRSYQGECSESPFHLAGATQEEVVFWRSEVGWNRKPFSEHFWFHDIKTHLVLLVLWWVLPLDDCVASCIGHLENTGSRSYAWHPGVLLLYNREERKPLSAPPSLSTKSASVARLSGSPWQIKVSPNSDFFL